MFVCASVSGVLCDKTKEPTADIFIPHKKSYHSSFMVGDAPFHLKFAFKLVSVPSHSKNADMKCIRYP